MEVNSPTGFSPFSKRKYFTIKPLQVFKAISIRKCFRFSIRNCPSVTNPKVKLNSPFLLILSVMETYFVLEQFNSEWNLVSEWVSYKLRVTVKYSFFYPQSNSKLTDRHMKQNANISFSKKSLKINPKDHPHVKSSRTTT